MKRKVGDEVRAVLVGTRKKTALNRVLFTLYSRPIGVSWTVSFDCKAAKNPSCSTPPGARVKIVGFFPRNTAVGVVS